MTSMPEDIAFRIDRLSVSFDPSGGDVQRSPIQGFNLDIGKGEITCLLGPSGCGKTTLLRTLGGLSRVEPSGGVLFHNQWISGMLPEIVMIFQENNLYPWLNVRRNIAFGLPYAKGSDAEKAARLTDIENTVGLAEASDKYPHELSGGMRQRVAIARALVVAPEVLLLDEPFSALDVALRRRMYALLRKIREATQTTFVMVTHNIEEAISVGHRVIVLGDRPMRVKLDQRIDEALRDRYSRAHMELERQIESLIEGQAEGSL